MKGGGPETRYLRWMHREPALRRKVIDRRTDVTWRRVRTLGGKTRSGEDRAGKAWRPEMRYLRWMQREPALRRKLIDWGTAVT